MPSAIVADTPLTKEEAELAQQFIAFLKRASDDRPRGPGGVVLRFNQGRATACVDA